MRSYRPPHIYKARLQSFIKPATKSRLLPPKTLSAQGIAFLKRNCNGILRDRGTCLHLFWLYNQQMFWLSIWAMESPKCAAKADVTVVGVGVDRSWKSAQADTKWSPSKIRTRWRHLSHFTPHFFYFSNTCQRKEGASWSPSPCLSLDSLVSSACPLASGFVARAEPES